MRAFLAVTGGERLTAALTTALYGWRTGPGGRLPVRWTRPDTWHLTLQFLGEWPESRLETLKTGLNQACREPAFTLAPGLLGGFPDLASPRVLFLHMEDDGQAARLTARVRAIVEVTWPEGPQDTRPFRGHLTLARIRQRLARDELKLLQEINLGPLPPVPVDGFSLVASELCPTGPRYTELAFFPLRK